MPRPRKGASVRYCSVRPLVGVEGAVLVRRSFFFSRGIIVAVQRVSGVETVSGRTATRPPSGESRAITGIDQREELLSWAEQLAVALEPRDQAASRAIRQASAAHAENRFVLTVLGKAKRGKSTLVNALLGRGDDQLAPIDKLPASNVLTRFAFADTLTAKAFFRPSTAGGAASQQVISPQHVRDYVTEESNPANCKNVECVEVVGPFPRFDRDLVMIDTPGAGSIHEYHDDIIRAAIPQSDAVVFLVTAQMPLDQDELDLLRQLRDADVRKIIFAINRVDQVPPSELDQAETHNRGLLQQVGLAVDRIHRISAKRAVSFHDVAAAKQLWIASIGSARSGPSRAICPAVGWSHCWTRCVSYCGTEKPKSWPSAPSRGSRRQSFLCSAGWTRS